MSNLHSLWQEFVEDLRKKRPSKTVQVCHETMDSFSGIMTHENIEIIDLDALFKAMDEFGDQLRRRLDK